MKPISRVGVGNKKHLTENKIPLSCLGISDYDNISAFKAVQSDLREKGWYQGGIDGYFWTKSCAAFKEANKTMAIINGQLVEPPKDLEWLCYFSPMVHEFKSRRKIKPSEIVVHESVTSSWESTVNVLMRRHLGVHLMIHIDGTVTQHADLYQKLSHAGGTHNKRSIAVEVINRYVGSRARGNEKDRVIKAKWAWKKSYICPTKSQIESLASMLHWLTESTDVPMEWVGMAPGRYMDAESGFTMNRLKNKAPKPGIWAHTYFAHSDGAWPIREAYKILKSKGLTP